MSLLPIVFHPHARFEVEEARDWYLQRKKSPLAARRLIEAVDDALVRIQTDPLRWPLHMSKTRRLLLRRFLYLVIYDMQPASIRIVAFAHTRRRPGYWIWRLAH